MIDFVREDARILDLGKSDLAFTIKRVLVEVHISVRASGRVLPYFHTVRVFSIVYECCGVPNMPSSDRHGSIQKVL
jgi:hypothetical protein